MPMAMVLGVSEFSRGLFDLKHQLAIHCLMEIRLSNNVSIYVFKIRLSRDI